MFLKWLYNQRQGFGDVLGTPPNDVGIHLASCLWGLVRQADGKARPSRIRGLAKLECSRDNRFDLSHCGHGRFRTSLLSARRKSHVAARGRCLGRRRDSDSMGHDLGVQAANLRQPAPRLPETGRRPGQPGRPTRTAIVYREHRQPARSRFARRICGALRSPSIRARRTVGHTSPRRSAGRSLPTDTLHWRR